MLNGKRKEIKGSGRIEGKDLRPLKAFIQEHRPKNAYLVCNERISRVHENIKILNWRDFLDMLWDGFIIK